MLQQDNKNAMKLELNGRESSTKGSKRIRVGYFFTKERVENADKLMNHCPTGLNYIFGLYV